MLLQHLVKAGIAVSEDVAKQLENFVCKLYGYKEPNLTTYERRSSKRNAKKKEKLST